RLPMGYFKWGFRLVVLLGLVAFFHYSLPQHDIVRIVDTDVTRMDVGNDADGNPITRDVRFIYAKYPDDGEMEYRNEDTGWGFPWFFKFDSANLANRATDFKSSADTAEWVIVTHYGWRIPMFDMFPNAISIGKAEGPDQNLIPWFNIIFLTVLILGILVIRRIFIIWRKQHVDPVVDAIDQEIDETASWWRKLFRKK
ncbi:MAG: DUF1523 family protein, partial [Pseudomonadota bacterium]